MSTYPTYKLGEIVDFYSGFGFPKNLQGKRFGKYPFYKVGDISQNVQKGYSYLTLCDNYIDDVDLSTLKGILLPESTLVFAKIGEALKLNRRALTREKCLIDNNVIGIKAKENLCLEMYLFYYFKTIKLEKYSRATTVPSVRKSDIEQIPLPLPPPPTQHQIVSRIESLFAELDKAVEHLRTAQQQLKTFKQAVLNHWLNNEEGKWKMVKIESVANVVSGYAFKSNLFKDSGKYQIIRIGNIRPGIIRINESPVYYDEIPSGTGSKVLLKKKDVIITLTGTRKKRDYGYTAMVTQENLLLNQRLAYFRFDNKQYEPAFFLYYSWTDSFKDNFFSYETGNVGQGNVGIKAITKTEIPIPPLPEQQRIVEEIEFRLSQAEAAEARIAEALQKTEALRQSILKKAFSGELVVSTNSTNTFPQSSTTSKGG